ncbi:rcc01693 family protein [Consotaella aegiceratis]|uniref:rcc01693 family protein n=1 Tax=Consotaella aegiceratis TaxID=3097961 RepID=UPI002F41C4BA
MSAGLGLLRLSSKDFWAMTPCELAQALAFFLPDPLAPLGRPALDDLMRRFPDMRGE